MIAPRLSVALGCAAFVLAGAHPAHAQGAGSYWDATTGGGGSRSMTFARTGPGSFSMDMQTGPSGPLSGPVSLNWSAVEIATVVANGGSASVSTSAGMTDIQQGGIWLSPPPPNATVPTTGVTFTSSWTWMGSATAAASFTYDNLQQKFTQEGSATATVTETLGNSTWHHIPDNSLQNLPNYLQASSPNPTIGGIGTVSPPPPGQGATGTGFVVHQRAGTITISNGTSWGSGCDIVVGKASISNTLTYAQTLTGNWNWPLPHDFYMSTFQPSASSSTGSAAGADMMLMCNYSAKAAP